MDSQDGIPVRSMRLKVLYTFDDASRTNCLARWPHLLDIQTAHLDEDTQIGVIELKTCIQAIVSASPELVAKLGQDYTVYAYDYSEYETPLVGQGMLSWVLASASPTPNAPAHQSKTMVTGRVCKNVLGLFSKGIQETLEVKLRLVPVPTVKQSEYIESMQRYRELSNVIPHEFDAQMWTNFLRQNPAVLESKTQLPDGAASSPVDHSGIERVRQILSEGSTPREFSTMSQNEPNQASSPPQSTVAPSRHSTPGGQRPSNQQPWTQKLQRTASQNDVIRPSSSASMQEPDFTTLAEQSRRGSIQSGYGSGDESQDPQPRKRAKLYRTKNPGKSDLNIEKQPSSLRVAASTAASVRIHRPIPVNPSIAAEQNSTVEPVRPPTPISDPNDMPRRSRPLPSMLREQSNLSNTEYTSPYPMSDDNGDQNAHSPEESRYQGLFEPSFSMPSSPPVLDCGFPGPSSPALPPIATDPDSGFMSGGVEDLLDDDIIPLDEGGGNASNVGVREKRTVRPAVNANSPGSAASREKQAENPHETNTERPPAKEAAPPLPRPPPSAAGSRPSSRGSVRLAPKPIAPAPISQSDVEHIMSAVPASDPVVPHGLQHAQSDAGPMSDIPSAETPAPQPAKDGKLRSGTNKKKTKQIQARLDQCIRKGQAPPYCQNCGAIETPTWRRAWSKEIDGSEERAKEMANDPTSFYWQSLERDNQGRVIKFKIVKKSLLDADNDFTQVLLCNPCGLWLHKSKTMRPENRWYQDSNKNRKRKAKPKGPLNGGSQTTKPRKTQSGKPTESSPVATDASSPPEDETPHPENNEIDEDFQGPPSKRRRANSVEPRRSSDTAKSHWDDHDPMEALRRAIQSSPVRNLQRRNAPADKNLTPKPVRRALFTNSHNGGASRPLGETSGNSPRRSPRNASREAGKRSQDKENQTGTAHEGDCLFRNSTFDFDLPTSPTPRRRNTRADATGEKRLSLPTQSPTRGSPKGASDATPTKRTAQMLQRIQGAVTPCQNKTRQPHSNGPSPLRQPQPTDTELPPLPDNFNAEAFEGMETMMADMFDNNSNADFLSFDPSKFTSGGDWVGWFTSEAGTPVGSDEGHANGEQGSEDFMNAILSDPGMQKGNMQFDPFGLGDSNVLDSGFFGSESFNQDMMPVGSKEKPTDNSPAGEQNQQEAANNNAS